jgi:hypothetical protein
MLLQSISPQLGHLLETEEVNLVKQLILQVQGGACGVLDRASIEEEYDVTFSRSDEDMNVREALILESLVRCLEHGAERSRRWIMRNILEVKQTPNSLCTMLICTLGVLATPYGVLIIHATSHHNPFSKTRYLQPRRRGAAAEQTCGRSYEETRRGGDRSCLPNSNSL